MSEPGKATRIKFWQLHLSTAVLIMLAMGTLMYANTRGRFTGGWVGYPPDGRSVGFVNFGWPMEMVGAVYEIKNDVPVGNKIAVYGFSGDLEPARDDYGLLNWRVRFAVDIVCSVAILFAVAFASEWLIRRREARKP